MLKDDWNGQSFQKNFFEDTGEYKVNPLTMTERRPKPDQKSADHYLQRGDDLLFVLPELRKAFNQIDAATMPRKEAIKHKKAVILEIKRKNLIDKEVLKNYWTVYVGSGTDFEYPFLLGARSIVLVDPGFQLESEIEKVRQKVKFMAGEKYIEVSDHEFKFTCNLGEGDEIVTIKIDAALYGSPEVLEHVQAEDEGETIERLRVALEADPDDDFISSDIKEQFRTKTGIFAPDYLPVKIKKISRFQPPGHIALLLGYRTGMTNLDDDTEAMTKLVPGGYILADNMFASFIDSVSDQERDEFLWADSPRKPIELMRGKWKEKGYEFIPLEVEGDNYHYTFLKKSQKK